MVEVASTTTWLCSKSRVSTSNVSATHWTIIDECSVCEHVYNRDRRPVCFCRNAHHISALGEVSSAGCLFCTPSTQADPEVRRQQQRSHRSATQPGIQTTNVGYYEAKGFATVDDDESTRKAHEHLFAIHGPSGPRTGGASDPARMGRKLGGPLACHWPATNSRGPATRLAAQGLLHRALAQLKGAAMIADWQQAALRAWPGRSVCLHVYNPPKRQPSKLDGEAESTLLQRASRGVAFIDSSPCLGLQAQQRLKTTVSPYRDGRETYYIPPPRSQSRLHGQLQLISSMQFPW